MEIVKVSGLPSLCRASISLVPSRLKAKLRVHLDGRRVGTVYVGNQKSAADIVRHKDGLPKSEFKEVRPGTPTLVAVMHSQHPNQ